MSQQTSVVEPAIRRLERQAAESIDEDTDLLTVVRESDFSTAEVSKASEAEWNARYDYEPMVRSFYCTELAEFTTEELHEYISDAERALEPEDKSDVFSWSEQRYIDKKAKKVTQALCEYVFPAMDLNRPDERTRYDDTAFFELQRYLGLTDAAAAQGSRLFEEGPTREHGDSCFRSFQ